MTLSARFGHHTLILLRMTIVLMLLYSGLSIGLNVIPETLSQGGSIDFHMSWGYGHFVRQGQSPLRAFLERPKLVDTVWYLDEAQAQPPVPVYAPPGLTAPVALLLSVFSFFSWPLAKLLWLLCNLGFMLATPWMVIRLLPGGRRLSLTLKLLVCAAFYALQGTRLAVSVGQNTLIVLVLMLGSLLTRNKSWLLSGLLLGFALSKYSLALPVFLFLAFERRYRVVAVGLLVQALGVLVMSLLGRESLISVVGVYFRVLRSLSGVSGVHLAGLFRDASPAVLGIVLTVAVLGLLMWADRPRLAVSDSRTSELDFARFHVLTILVLWGLLVGYHSLYDTAVVVIFIGLILYGLSKPLRWNLPPAAVVGVAAFLTAFVAVLCVPRETIRVLLPQDLARVWYSWVNAAVTVSLVLALGVSLWLLRRVQSPLSEA